MINSTQQHFTHIAGSAALGAMATMGAAFAQSGAYLPSDDLVVVEMESLADGAGWSGSNSVEGFAGKGYVAWTGPDMSKKPGEGLVGFETSIQEGGTYELRLRNRHDHPDVTDANDVWVRIDGGEWTKVFSSFRGEWTWDTRHRTADGKVGPVVLEMEPGVHKVEFSGRSEGFMIDRVHLYKQGATNALSIQRAPSQRVAPEKPAEPEAAAVETTEQEAAAVNEDAAPMFAEDGGFDAPTEAPSEATPKSDSKSAGEAGGDAAPKTLPVRQPGLTFSPFADAVVADKVRTRFTGADDTAGATKERSRVEINEALDRYSESALRRGLSRFDIALGLEGTSTGLETGASQGPFVAKNYLENTVDQNKGLRIRALRMNREPRTLESAAAPALPHLGQCERPPRPRDGRAAAEVGHPGVQRPRPLLPGLRLHRDPAGARPLRLERR